MLDIKLYWGTGLYSLYVQFRDVSLISALVGTSIVYTTAW